MFTSFRIVLILSDDSYLSEYIMSSKVLVSPRILQTSEVSGEAEEVVPWVWRALTARKALSKGPFFWHLTPHFRLWPLLKPQKGDTNQYGHSLLAIILLNLSFPFCTDELFSQRLLCIWELVFN